MLTPRSSARAITRSDCSSSMSAGRYSADMPTQPSPTAPTGRPRHATKRLRILSRMPEMRKKLRLAALIALAALAVPLTASQASSDSGSTGHANTADTHSPRTERMLTARAAPNKGAVLGIDVASQQHDGGAVIDWSKVAAAGYKFVFIKTTEGSYYANPFFGSDFSAAKAAGMLVAPYHFANPGYSSGTLQADFAVDHAGIGSDGVTLPLIVDLEYDPYSSNKCYGLTVPQMVSWISAFNTEAYRLTGQHPVIYTLADWWQKCTGGSAAFAADPLWVASYK